MHYLCIDIKNTTMNLDNTKAQMRKGILEYCIFLIISQKDAYTPDIIAKLQESRIIVVEGTIYPLLTHLKNSGFLEYRWEESSQGPPRKYYRLTDKGFSFLNELDSAWEELIFAVNNVKENYQTQLYTNEDE